MKLKYAIIGVVAVLISAGGYFFGAELAHEKYEEVAVPTEVVEPIPVIEVEATSTPADLESNLDYDGEMIEEEFEVSGTNTDLYMEEDSAIEAPSLFEEDLQSM